MSCTNILNLFIKSVKNFYHIMYVITIFVAKRAGREISKQVYPEDTFCSMSAFSGCLKSSIKP